VRYRRYFLSVIRQQRVITFYEKREKREKTEIGIHAVRGGTIVGEHDIIFAGRDEVIEFNHKAMSKDIFAVGAVKAAKFLAGQKAGFYTMKDVM